jgi:hypothetical protein
MSVLTFEDQCVMNWLAGGPLFRQSAEYQLIAPNMARAVFQCPG